MIIRSTGGADFVVGANAAEWGTESWIPAPGIARISEAGLPVTEYNTFGIPAVSSVMRSAAELIASMPFITYTDTDIRERAVDSWQYKLLHDAPCDDCDTFTFFYDLILSLEAAQNAFIQKAKDPSGQVVALKVIDPQRVRVRRDADGDKVFDVTINNTGEMVRGLTTEDILHIRGFTLHPGDVAGTSLLDIHRDPLGNAMAMQRFEGDYFRNYAMPPFWFTGAANKQQAQDMIDLHNMKHRGAGNQWKAGGLWGNADVKALPISVRDAMFIEAKNMSIEDICRIWRWPRSLIEIGEVRESTIDWNVVDSHVLKIYVLPRLRRIERAFAADPDLYLNTKLYGEFLTDVLERADVHSRYDAYRLARQGGWVTANELRARENLPPLEGGDELQETPVGGAPNQAGPDDNSSTDNANPAQQNSSPRDNNSAEQLTIDYYIGANGHKKIDTEKILDYALRRAG